jgi:FkbM family methyltransferase
MNNVKSFIYIIIKKIYGIKLYDLLLSFIRSRYHSILYNGKKYTFFTPNSVCLWRARTFSSKEPETLNWIKGFHHGSIFWDIGANVGLYSIFAAKNNNCKVLSFEPSIFNLEVLGKNIFKNNCTDLITIIPLAISNKIGKGLLNMSSLEYGGALSTFDKTYGSDGNVFDIKFKFSILSIALDDLTCKLNFEYPDYIKIDVDGIEQLILEGGINVLKNAKSILIELPDLWKEQKDACEQILVSAGFEIMLNSDWDINLNPNGSPNQIWIRK